MSHWKPVILPAAFLVFITSLPQLYICLKRGSQWNGSYALIEPDELGYSSYVNSIIHGRPRRFDPYTGRESPETFLSLQCIPAYVLAIPARLLHLSASTMFIILTPLMSLIAAVVLFKFLLDVTQNAALSGVAVLGVVFLGVACANISIPIITGQTTGFTFIPFLRRTVPSVVFPVFCAFFLFVWRALIKDLAWGICAAVSLGILVYSHFFLWTAAAAWLFTILLLWSIRDRNRAFQVTAVILPLTLFMIVPYILLVRQFPPSSSSAYSLEITHAPDLFRTTEIYGAIIIAWFFYRRPQLSSQLLLALSFAVAPIVVFNQQILSGKSLQPFHYEGFAANHWVLISTFLLWKSMPRRILFLFGFGSLVIGALISIKATQRYSDSNLELDQIRPAILNLPPGTVFAPNLLATNAIPSNTTNSVLWGIHMYTFGNVNQFEQRQRLFTYLYFSGFDEQKFQHAIQEIFSIRAEVFGHERANPALSTNATPISEQDIQRATIEFHKFSDSFDARNAPLISCALASRKDDLSSLDRWYERDPGEAVGDFVIYRLKLRP